MHSDIQTAREGGKRLEAVRASPGQSIRDQAIEAAFMSAQDRMPGVDLEAFTAAIAGWDVHPVALDGVISGAILVNGAELHACVLPAARGRWFNRRAASILADVIRRHGEALTTATTPAGRAFVERLGFVQDGAAFVKRH